MEKNHLKSPSIYLHVVVAMFIIQLLHKIVRDLWKWEVQVES
jgi:hypothetical protein